MLYKFAKKFYPRACENRLSSQHPAVKLNRPKFIKAAAFQFVCLQLLFFGLFCYLFGGLYQQVPRTHSLRVLWVDFDGGVIGDAVRDGYKSLQSGTFPTLIERPKSEFPSEAHVQEAVCKAHYWAAVYTSPRSSESLGLAISGSSTSEYNRSNVLTYIWNQARYPTVVDGAISSNLQTLSNAARTAYFALNGTAALSTVPSNNTDALMAFTNPWTLSSINLQATRQGSRAVYNTIVIVLVLMQDFFYLGIINGVYVQFKIYTRIRPSRVILVRDLISTSFTAIGALFITAAIWIFKGDWHVTGHQFALNWLIMWLFAHVNFLTLDVFTIWLPPPYVPWALICWVVTNITSILLPFELSSPFYKWAYALPAHEAYEALTDNWSRGCNPHLHYALPILFAYEVSGLFWTALGVYKRCHFAVVAEEAAEEAMRMRVDMALKLERQHDRRLRRESKEKSAVQREEGAEGYTGTEAVLKDTEPESPEEKEDLEADRREAEAAIVQANNEIEHVETRATQMAQFGPAFPLVHGQSGP